MGGRFIRGTAYAALFAVVLVMSCQASFVSGVPVTAQALP